MTKPIALVIDDDPNLGFAFEITLEMAGFDVERIADSQKALDKIKEIMPDVITLDMNMPMVSGKDILNDIRSDESLAHIKVIVVTANERVRDEMQVMDQADLILIKPVTMSQIKDLATRFASAS